MTTVLAILIGAPGGYALASFAFPGKDGYRLLILLIRASPIPILALPFATLVSSSLFMGIPRELEEAAWTLGCTRLQAFTKIFRPLARPGITATRTFAFVVSWNEGFAASVSPFASARSPPICSRA